MADMAARERARELALARYRLRWHVPVYVLVNAGLVLVWLNAGAGFFWPGFPIVFWGLGVFFHYLTAYRSDGSAWVDQETDKVLRELEESGRGRP